MRKIRILTVMCIAGSLTFASAGWVQANDAHHPGRNAPAAQTPAPRAKAKVLKSRVGSQKQSGVRAPASGERSGGGRG